MNRVFYLFLSIFVAVSAFSQTPNMSIDKPTVGVTTGPQWAQMLNDALDVVDAHDHSSGKGLQVGPSGLNINADLEFNGHNATELRTTRFSSQSSSLAGASEIGQLYNVAGNLYWNNNTGVAVPITSGTAVVSSISNAFTTSTPGAYPYSVTVADTQKVLLVDTGSTRTLNLPAATTVVMFLVKDTAGLAASNNITVAPNGANTIDGAAASKALAFNYGMWLFISDGVSNWSTSFMPGTTVPLSAGGTGAIDAPSARTSLGVVIDTDVQAFDADLTTLGGLSKTDGNFIVADGADWTVESGNTARTSLSLGTGDSPTFNALTLSSSLTTPIVSLTAATGTVFTNTSDGADNKAVQLGHSATSRGSYILLRGNEASTPGEVEISSGNVANSRFSIKNPDSAYGIDFHTAGTQRWSFNPSGHIVPFATNTYDVGTSSNRVKDIYITGNIEKALSTWVPTITGSGGAVISAVSINEAHYQRIGAYIHFTVSATFTIGTAAPTVITLTVPTAGVDHNVNAAYACSADANGSALSNARWRQQGGLLVFPAGGGTFAIGSNAAVNIEGKYRAI